MVFHKTTVEVREQLEGVFSLFMWDPGIKVRSSALAESTYTYSVIFYDALNVI